MSHQNIRKRSIGPHVMSANSLIFSNFLKYLLMSIYAHENFYTFLREINIFPDLLLKYQMC